MDHTVFVMPSRYFARHNFNVYAFDLPCHGLSEGPICEDIDAFADWLASAVNELGIATAAIVGHSMGSLIALNFAARYPKRTRTLSLLGTSTPMPVSDALLSAAKENDHDAIDMANTSEQQWSCHLCTFANEFKQQQCTMCGTSRKSQDDVLGKDWECPRCTYRNSAGQKKCELCHQEAPTRPFDDYEDTSVNAGGGGGVL